MTISKALTWNELADMYDKVHSSRPARTLRMETVFEWAERQIDQFYVDPKEGTIHLWEQSTKQRKGDTQ